MNWEEIRERKEDSIRESTGNPMPNINGKNYKNFSDFLASKEYNDFLDSQEKALDEYKQKAKEYFNSLDTDNQLLLFFHITNMIFENYYKEGGSYRHLLYDKFDFGPEAYGLGIDSGMFTIHNSIFTPVEMEENIKAVVKHFNLDLSSKDIQSFKNIMNYGCNTSVKLDSLISGQQKFDFDEKKDPE